MPRLATTLLVSCSLAFIGAGCQKRQAVAVTDASGPSDGAEPDGGGAGADSASEGAPATCAFAATGQLAAKIRTVGIVTWSTDLPDVRRAWIDFGLTTAYGMTAPVDLGAAGYRTLLLGMKQNRTYHYRIVAGNDRGECASPDYSITTEALVTGLAKITVLDKSGASPLYGGFLIAGQYLPVPVGGMPAYIADADGDVVWAYLFARDVTGARMSYDGKLLWLNSANVPSTQGAVVHRVSLDGELDEDLSDKLAGLNHQLAVLPDETVAFNAYGESGCDDLKEYAPATGLVRTVANTGTAQGGIGKCHIVNVQHSRDDDTLVFSDLDNQTVVKVRRSDGATVWIINGPSATLGGAPWQGSQHSLHVLGLDHLLLFNNNIRAVTSGAAGSGDGSIAIELRLDLDARTVAPVWAYKAEPGIQNDIMGDVQRLPNGNTLVGYSLKGVLQEVDAAGVLLQEWTWPLGASFGYIEKRASLYGPPPR